MPSKRTKELSISDETRKKVLERQGGLSITRVWASTYEFHHYVERGQGGVGYEFNLVALTPQEHRQLHDKTMIKVGNVDRYTSDELETLIVNHLQLHYNNWSREKCKYKKGKEEKDYGVKRKNIWKF